MAFQISKDRKNVRSIKLGLYKASIQGGCLVVSKVGNNHHLTGCVNARLGGLDFHFKNNAEPDIVLKRFLIKFSDIEKFQDENLDRIMELILNWKNNWMKPINIGKLVKFGYWPFLPDENGLIKGILRGHPSEKRTIVISKKNFGKRIAAVSLRSCYHPSILRYLPPEELNKPIFLLGTKRKSRHKKRVLAVFQEDGKTNFYLARQGNLFDLGADLFPKELMEGIEEFKAHFVKYFEVENIEKELTIG